MPRKEDVNTSNSNISGTFEQSDSEGFTEVVSKRKRRQKRKSQTPSIVARKRLLVQPNKESDIETAKQKSTEEKTRKD